jgi:hypothetical protein
MIPKGERLPEDIMPDENIGAQKDPAKPDRA